MDAKPKMKCISCGGEEFDAEAGHFYCCLCRVQHENLTDMKYDEQFEDKKSSHRVKFAKSRVDNNRGEFYNDICTHL